MCFAWANTKDSNTSWVRLGIFLEATLLGYILELQATGWTHLSSTFLTSSVQIYLLHYTRAHTSDVFDTSCQCVVIKMHAKHKWCGLIIHFSGFSESQPKHWVLHKKQHRLYCNQRWTHSDKCDAAVTRNCNHQGRATFSIFLPGSWKEGVVSSREAPWVEFH